MAELGGAQYVSMCAHVHVFSSLCGSSSSFVECVTHLNSDVLILEVKNTAKLLIIHRELVQTIGVRFQKV